MDFKLTGNIHEDVDTLYDAVEYIAGMADTLVMEEIAQHDGEKGRMALYLEMLSVRKALNGAAEHANRMRREERKCTYGPLAGREDM